MEVQTFLGLDYPTVWFIIVGILFTGYAILDGFDFGAGAWHLFIKKEEDRRIALNAIGPVWDGNEVWLVIGGGALFAGYPLMYATLFSAMYTPFMLFLLFIILRAVSIEFRGKENMKWWRKTWDIIYSVSSIILSLLLGVVVGNVLLGIRLDSNHEYIGDGLFEFLNPFSILVGLVTLFMFMSHGAIYLLMKTSGKLYEQFRVLFGRAIIIFIISFIIVSIYAIGFNSHLKEAFEGKWYFVIVPLLACLSIANTPRLVYHRKYNKAFFFSSLTIFF